MKTTIAATIVKAMSVSILKIWCARCPSTSKQSCHNQTDPLPAFGGHCHGLNSPAVKLSPVVSVADRGDAKSLILDSGGHRSLILASAPFRVEPPISSLS